MATYGSQTLERLVDEQKRTYVVCGECGGKEYMAVQWHPVHKDKPICTSCHLKLCPGSPSVWHSAKNSAQGSQAQMPTREKAESAPPKAERTAAVPAPLPPKAVAVPTVNNPLGRARQPRKKAEKTPPYVEHKPQPQTSWQSIERQEMRMKRDARPRTGRWPKEQETKTKWVDDFTPEDARLLSMYHRGEINDAQFLAMSEISIKRKMAAKADTDGKPVARGQ